MWLSKALAAPIRWFTAETNANEQVESNAMKLQVICRGSITEGLGHLFRTRTFIKAAQKQHSVEVIAIVEQSLEALLHELQCPVHYVRSDSDAIPYVKGYAPDVLLFDLTRIDDEVFRAMARVPCMTVSLSPIFDHMADIDVLFTRAIRTPPIPGVRIIGGLEYAIFNDHGMVIDDATYERNLSMSDLPIAVCMGGTDAANKTLAVLQALVMMEREMTIWVLLGEGYAHSYNALVDTVRDNRSHEIVLAKTNRSMWRVMSNCALAILAGGLTTVEAIYAGLPTINLFERTEHFDVMQELCDLRICLNGGQFSTRSLLNVVQTIAYLDENRDELQTIRNRTKGMVDTKGSERILRELQNLVETRLREKPHGI